MQKDRIVALKMSMVLAGTRVRAMIAVPRLNMVLVGTRLRWKGKGLKKNWELLMTLVG